MKEYADKIGIEFFCSAFYPEAIKFLISIGVKRFKVASRTCLFTDPFSEEVLEKKASSKKEIIISMGMGGNTKKIKKIFDRNKTIFCYCISDYPLEFKKINWNEAMKFEGFSDHTIGITAPLIFAVMKKEKNAEHILIEKHVKLKESTGPDAETSIDTDRACKKSACTKRGDAKWCGLIQRGDGNGDCRMADSSFTLPKRRIVTVHAACNSLL